MTEQLTPNSLRVRYDQPLIGVIVQENGQEVTRYFADEQTADAAIQPSATEQALSVVGAWSDLDWEEMELAFDHIRHDSPPTPPITEL